VQVRVETICRLHFGFMNLTGSSDRLNGSMGVALNSPNTVVTVVRNNKLVIKNGNEKKILGFVTKFSKRYHIEPNLRIEVEKSIPEHLGLGSGTQLALAISVALAKINDIPIDIRKISAFMGRGKRSQVGIACFDMGGFIIDADEKIILKDDVAPSKRTIFRREFPENWCFVLVIPETEIGLSGEIEEAALKRVTPSKKISAEICKLVQGQLLPSFFQEDIQGFGSALTEIDRRTGMYFGKAQGGVYRDKMGKEIIECLLRSGAYGVGQSSWGPTLYGLVKEKESRQIADRMRHFLTGNKIKGRVLVSHCNNTGAKIIINSEKSIQRVQFDTERSLCSI